MRVQLYRDRQKLEALLAEAERIFDHKKPSAKMLEQAATLQEALAPFAYVEEINPVVSDERELQARFLRIYWFCQQSVRDGVPRLMHELQRAPSSTQRTVLQAYETFQPTRFAPPLQLQAYRDELRAIFSAEHLVSDGSLERQCLRLTHILSELQKSKTNILAQNLIHYIRRESSQLQMTLAEHFQQALLEYPQKLRAAGKSAIETNELLRLYTQDCTAVDRLLDTIVQQTTKPSYFYEKQLIIGAPSKADCDSLERQLRDYGVIERFQHIPYLVLQTDHAQATALLGKPRSLFTQHMSVHEPYPYRVQPTVSVFHDSLWSLDLVQAPQAWEKTRGKGATVAVIDTGIDYNHDEVKNCFGSVVGVDFVNGDDPFDDNGHGTHVAGTVAGNKTGVAPEASLYAVKVLSAEGTGSEVSVLRGIEWAMDNNTHIINMSLGSPYASDAEARLISYAAKKGIAVVCAAGNNGDNSYNYPASHPGAISVAAVDRFSERAKFSNYNDMIDLAAPGMEVYSAWPNGSYRVLSGTSMASPHVAGGCALLQSFGIKDMEEQLYQGAKNLGDAEYYGGGLIQLAETLNGKQRTRV